MKVIAGVDCHKGSHSIAFIDAVGKLLGTVTIKTTAAEYQRAIGLAREFGEVAWGLESTGCYGSAFAKLLCAEGFVVYEVPGSYTKRHRSHASHRGKSDPIDAQAIAEVVLREADRLPVYRYSVEREAIRLRYDQRDRLVRERTKAINRLRSAALRLNLSSLPADLTTRKALGRLESAVGKHKGLDIALDAVVDDAVYAIEDVARINKRIVEIERILDPLMRRLTPELLETHGVSTVAAAGLFGHAGDLRNCRNADAFAMRSGTAPVPCSSGKRQVVRLNVGGNRQLNRLLFSIAVAQIRTENHVGRQYYDRKRQEGKNHSAAIRCLKRRLAAVVYYRLLAAQQRYSTKVAALAA
jgi:transposase